jgi:hypothetical protein
MNEAERDGNTCLLLYPITFRPVAHDFDAKATFTYLEVVQLDAPQRGVFRRALKRTRERYQGQD